ncbi:MAG: hypothetical protein WAU60_13780 [Candidatus Competibacter denitrificans]|jgi:hypothetical protein|uniref:Uncharacterized protein n=1 Tax=Candidatus Competibacter denitrificans Run_A_D11 TaxID=1400863 RepID=W6M1C9_9GAMM|nr:hypothetical protein [Candidatus Competibacter denitrificans]CDI01242.1 conserved hypothetical protein [Candidatus Competibacter denitrificans Run_A_D11]HRC68295.1 hypothetical protein [Candidatus Competibacter denitrificans]
MTQDSLSGSTARNPDLDWSQIRETILMLALSVAQIEMSMRDSDGSVEVLSNSFTSMAGQVKMIERTAASLPESAETTEARAAIIENCASVGDMMRSAIVAFQFYDKLTQRLNHVTSSLGSLADLISDVRRLYNPYEWLGMQEKIRSRYTMEEERLMFEAIMQGKTIKQALVLYVQAMEEKKHKTGSGGASPDEEVELF